MTDKTEPVNPSGDNFTPPKESEAQDVLRALLDGKTPFVGVFYQTERQDHFATFEGESPDEALMQATAHAVAVAERGRKSFVLAVTGIYTPPEKPVAKSSTPAWID